MGECTTRECTTHHHCMLDCPVSMSAGMEETMEGVQVGVQTLEYDHLRSYVNQQHEFRCLDQDFTFIKAREVPGGPCVWKAAVDECESLLCEVVMPFFMCSNQLLRAVWGNAQHVMDWHRDDSNGSCPDKPVGVEYSLGMGLCWLKRPGLVRLDPRRDKKKREIKSACVYPAVSSKIIFDTDRQVEFHKAGTYQQLEFWLNGRQVGREEGRGGAPDWVAVTGNDERRVRVRLYLHQLVFYLAKGYTGLPQIPYGQSRVIIHLGECKGCCCCPWHFKQGDKSENSLRANQFRKWRGRHTREYTELPKGYELPNL